MCSKQREYCEQEQRWKCTHVYFLKDASDIVRGEGEERGKRASCYGKKQEHWDQVQLSALLLSMYRMKLGSRVCRQQN